MQKLSFFLIGIFYPLIAIIAVLLLAIVQLRSSAGADFDMWRFNYKAALSLNEAFKKEAASLLADLEGTEDNLLFDTYCTKYLVGLADKKEVIDAAVFKSVNPEVAPEKRVEKPTGNKLCLVRGGPHWEVAAASDKRKKESIQAKITDLETKISSNYERVNDLSRTNKDFMAFVAMEDAAGLDRFIPRVPYDLLVLLLVMSMGALGGIVRLLRDYGDKTRSNPDARDYFFVPLIGLVVAIGGFVLAKAGLLLLSSTRQEASLSPFMIGLVGIVSGLLAREVIDAIAQAGANIMGQQGPREAP